MIGVHIISVAEYFGVVTQEWKPLLFFVGALGSIELFQKEKKKRNVSDKSPTICKTKQAQAPGGYAQTKITC